MDVPENAQARRAHDLCGEEPCLSGVHHAIGDIEISDQKGCECCDCDLAEIAKAEDQENERKHRCRRRRPEEVDEKLECAIDVRTGGGGKKKSRNPNNNPPNKTRIREK